MSGYPKGLVEKAEYELHVFERVSADTGQELLDEVKRHRANTANRTKVALKLHQAGLGNTGVGNFCAPGPAAEQKQAWMLMFDDRDRGTAIYYDEEEAYMAFGKAEAMGWNCNLLTHAPRLSVQIRQGGADAGHQ